MNQTIVNCASFASLIILVTNATAGAQLEIALLCRTIPKMDSPQYLFSITAMKTHSTKIQVHLKSMAVFFLKAWRHCDNNSVFASWYRCLAFYLN